MVTSWLSMCFLVELVLIVCQAWKGNCHHSCFLLGWTFGLFGREPTARSRVLPPCLKILVITHEKARVEDMDDYFAKKFYPLKVLYVIGRSYKAEPECRPDKTLFDAWQELVGRRLVKVTLSDLHRSAKVEGHSEPTARERKSRDICQSCGEFALSGSFSFVFLRLVLRVVFGEVLSTNVIFHGKWANPCIRRHGDTSNNAEAREQQDC